MEWAEGEILEGGSFQLFRRGSMPGWMFLILSPEGDSHRLIRLAPKQKRGDTVGTVAAVAGRPANLLIGLRAAAAALAAGPVAAGDYRLTRRLLLGEVDTLLRLATPEGDAAAVRMLDDGAGCRIGVCCPNPGTLPALPTELRARFEGRAIIAADPPHYLDYVGMRLNLTTEHRPWEPSHATAPWSPLPLGAVR